VHQAAAESLINRAFLNWRRKSSRASRATSAIKKRRSASESLPTRFCRMRAPLCSLRQACRLPRPARRLGLDLLGGLIVAQAFECLRHWAIFPSSIKLDFCDKLVPFKRRRPPFARAPMPVNDDLSPPPL
jgi:hypothetical protein